MHNKKNHLEFHAEGLKNLFPQGECTVSDDNVLTWIGELSPKCFSKLYKIKIKYIAFQEPEVRILSLGLIIPYNKEDIHMYSDGRLCLHFDEWKPHMSLAKSIVPWICEWLYFYEIWLVTRKWCGGGIHDK